MLNRDTPLSEVQCSDGTIQFEPYTIEEDIFKEYLSSEKEFEIPEGVKEIGDSAFYHSYSLVSVTIPQSVISIGENAFESCYNLMNLKINGIVMHIGKGAFSGCYKLRNITMPNGTKFIGDSAFSSCRELINVTIPNSVISIGKSAFRYCDSLTIITYNGTKKQFDTILKGEHWCNYKKVAIQCTDGQYSFGQYIINNGVFEAILIDKTELKIPEGVREIADYFVHNLIKAIVIPFSIVRIGETAFWGCTSIKSIEYAGTKAQWMAIEKAFQWNHNVRAKFVRCTDGEVYL